jgi:hypothetical protein
MTESHPLRSDDASASTVWYYLATEVGVPMALAKRGWKAIATSPSDLTLRYAFQRALDVGPPGSQVRHEAAQALLEGAGSPERLLEVLEACVTERRLSRRDATQLEDALLRAVDRDGAWR